MFRLFAVRRFASAAKGGAGKGAKEPAAAAASSAGSGSAVGKHAPPKKLYGIIGRYAEATYVAGSKAGQLDRVEAELNAFGNLLKKQPGFATFLSNPTVTRGEKHARLSAALDDSKFSHVSRNLFLTLAANGRANESHRVIAAFNDLVGAGRGSVEATVISADPLSEKVVEQIKKSIQGLTDGKQVDLKVEVDSKILGGLKVIIGDRSIDLSVQSRVQTLSAALESQ